MLKVRKIDGSDSNREAIQLDPYTSAYWKQKGDHFSWWLGRYEEAIVAYNKAIELDPNDAFCWMRKGDLLRELHRYKEALAAYDRTIELEPDNIFAWTDKANICVQLGHYEKALAAFDEAIERASNVPDFFWTEKGHVYVALKRYKDALEVYDTALEIEASSASWNGKGNVYLALEQYRQALEAYNIAIKLNPNDAYAWYGKGEVHQKKESMAQSNSNLIIFGIESLKYYFRAYFLRNAGIQIGRKVPQSDLPRYILEKFKTAYHAPFFIARVFRENPHFRTAFTWMHLLEQTEADSKYAWSYLDLVNHSNITKLKKLQLNGLVQYYMGDPIIAYDIFKKMDTEYESDLLGQYYLILSAEGFCVDSESLLQFALKRAKKFRKNSSKKEDHTNPLQIYYCGLIYYLASLKLESKKYLKEALGLFGRIQEFLPATYMAMLCKHRMKNEARSKDIIIQSIVRQEAQLRADGSRGYLDLVDKFDVQVNVADLSKPFQKYAWFMEILEAVVLMHNFLNKFEKENGKLPANLEFLDVQDFQNKKPNLLSWQLVEEAKAELEQIHANALESNIEKVKNKLRTFYTEIPLINSDLFKEQIELELASLIDADDFKDGVEKYHLLIELLFHLDKLHAQSAVILSFYTILVSRMQDKSFFDNPEKSFERVAEIAIGGISGASAVFNISVGMSVLLSAAGAAFTPYLVDFLKKLCMGTDHIPKFSYKYIRNAFIDFVTGKMEEHGDMFYVRYPFNNFHDWTKKLDLP